MTAMRGIAARVIARTALAAALLTCGAGCANTLMPTPVGLDRAGADPFTQTPPELRSTEVPVFIASNRGVAEQVPANSPSRFNDKRSQHMHLGVMTVDVGAGKFDWSTLEACSREDNRPDDPVVALRSIEDFGAMWTGATALDPDPALDKQVAEKFEAAVNAQLAKSPSKELFILVHGFNTTVPDNAALAAELFHFLGRDGAMVLFEWPSAGSVFAYQTDKSAATASIRGFRQFLNHVARRTECAKINIIAHSAGAPVAVEALHELRLMYAAETAAQVRTRIKLGRLVLVAPDMDLDEFRDSVSDGTSTIPERVTLYVSSRDKALDLSAWMAGFARLGQPLDVLTPRQVKFLEQDANVDIVDVVDAENRLGSWLGHSYFHDDPWVSTDVLLTLRTGTRPAQRGLVFDDNRKVFVFGKKYPEHARTAAKSLLSGGTGLDVPPEAGASAAPAHPPTPEAPEEAR